MVRYVCSGVAQGVWLRRTRAQVMRDLRQPLKLRALAPIKHPFVGRDAIPTYFISTNLRAKAVAFPWMYAKLWLSHR